MHDRGRERESTPCGRVGPWKLGQRGAPLGGSCRRSPEPTVRAAGEQSTPPSEGLPSSPPSGGNDDDTPRATAARASSPTTTADGGVGGRAERGAARTSRTSSTAAAAQREGPVLSPGGSEAAARLGRASRRRRGFTSPSSLDLDGESLQLVAVTVTVGHYRFTTRHPHKFPKRPPLKNPLCTLLVAGLVCSSLLVSRQKKASVHLFSQQARGEQTRFTKHVVLPLIMCVVSVVCSRGLLSGETPRKAGTLNLEQWATGARR